MRPDKSKISVKRAKRLRRELSLPEVMLWQFLRGLPNGHRFRKQHPAGPFVLDFFCARANLAIEIDGFAHETGDRPARDARRDAWLAEHRIDTLRIPAADVFQDVVEVANAIVAVVEERLASFGKAPPSALRAATSPSQVDGEDAPPSALRAATSPSQVDGEDAPPSGLRPATSPSQVDGEECL
jgi:very-short-patch-repair endonuclease